MNRTDRFLVGIAFIFFGMAMLSLLGFDDFLRLKNRDSLEKNAVAEIEKGAGDFRMKFHNEMAWLPGREKQKLVYDDAVFTGDGGQASLRMGDSQVTLESNTLVVIRKVKTVKHLSLTYGSLAAQISKNDKVAIETADGKKFEITAAESTKMSIQSSSKGTKVIVKSGSAKVIKEGQTQAQSLKASDKIVFESPKVEPDPIKITEPLVGRMYSVSSKELIKFGWAYSSGRPFKIADDFTLEVSVDPEMKTLILKERILGQGNWQADVDANGEFYYRVKDREGNLSEIRKLAFIRPLTPEVTQPKDAQEFTVPLAESAKVDIRVSGVFADGRVWIQIAKDSEFKDLIMDKNLPDGNVIEALLPGGYFVRARGVYGQVMTNWSVARGFSVSEKIDDQRLAQLSMPAKVIVPNLNYPKELYGAEDQAVQAYLKSSSPFAKYFDQALISGTDLMVSLRGITDKVKVDQQFPESWIRPGLAELVYQFEIGGRAKTEPRIHRFYVEMEPPKDVLFKTSGAANWSPILFARGYEGLIRDGSGRIERFNNPSPEFRAKLMAGNQYRLSVRALGENGIPISGWSSPVTIETPAPALPPIVRQMAKAEIKEVPDTVEIEPKQPQQPVKLTLASLKENLADAKKIVYRMGAWIWAGIGENYYSVKQTIADAADVDYENFKGPSTFFEAGILSRTNWGAAVSYKRTPGNIELNNQIVSPNVFVWDTYSAEALYGLPIKSKMLGLPVMWGLRMGVQYHKFPFLYVEPVEQTISRAQNSLLMGSFGAFADTTAKTWNYHWMMRYQHPFQSSAESGNEFTIKPNLAFDGSLGASYLFLNQWRTGLFWYGQLHDYSFRYRAPSILNDGKQTLFYSNLEFRLGVDF